MRLFSHNDYYIRENGSIVDGDTANVLYYVELNSAEDCYIYRGLDGNVLGYANSGAIRKDFFDKKVLYEDWKYYESLNQEREIGNKQV